MNLAAPIVEPSIPGWVALVKHELARAIPAYRRAIGLAAIGSEPIEAWSDFADALESAILVGVLAGVAAGQRDYEREVGVVPFSTFASVSVAIEPVEIGPFERGIEKLRETVIRSGMEMEGLKRFAGALADSILVAEKTKSAGLVAKLRAVIETQERSFYVRGATIEQVRGVRSVIERYMNDVGKPFDRQQYGEWSAVLRPIQAQLGVSDNRADTIVRTNTLRAYNNAHAERLERPDVQRVVPLVMLVEIHDRRTRGAPNGIYPGADGDNPGFHWQMDGLVGTMQQFREWGVVPPNGYRCRGSIRGLTLDECEEMGFVDPDTLALRPNAIRRHNGDRLKILAARLYPDPRFKRR